MSLLTLFAQLFGLIVGLMVVAVLWRWGGAEHVPVLLTLLAQLLGLIAGLTVVAAMWRWGAT